MDVTDGGTFHRGEARVKPLVFFKVFPVYPAEKLLEMRLINREVLDSPCLGDNLFYLSSKVCQLIVRLFIDIEILSSIFHPRITVTL